MNETVRAGKGEFLIHPGHILRIEGSDLPVKVFSVELLRPMSYVESLFY